MEMAEKQSVHRERLEAKVIEAGISSQTRGSYFAFILSLTAIVGGFFLIHEGRGVEGLTTIIVSVTGLVSVFFYSKHEQKKKRMEKATALESRKR